ncbi:MAG: endonuclease III [Candidatus Micrarchaeaceae archaeon]
MYKNSYIKEIFYRLERRYGKRPHTKLAHRNMTELFVAVLLSPQCSDNQVNKVTPDLFKNYKSFSDYANADISELTSRLAGLNYYKTKAKHLKDAAYIINSRFNGRVPKTIKELIELPGVGRKVANVILNEGYGINEGIAVDTHCGRVSRRLHLSRSGDPAKIEQDLLKKIPRAEWYRTSNLFIELGRDSCKARNRECYRCALLDICPSRLRKNFGHKLIKSNKVPKKGN